MSTLEIVISAVVSIATAALGPKAYLLLVAKIGQANASLLLTLAGQVVSAVEQQLASAPGTQKKAAAVAALKGLSDAHNLKVTDAGLHTAIESAVNGLPKWIDTNFAQSVVAQAQADTQVATPPTVAAPVEVLTPATIAPVTPAAPTAATDATVSPVPATPAQ